MQRLQRCITHCVQGTHSGSCMYRAKHRRPEGDIKVDINKSLLEDLTTKMASRFMVIPEAFLNDSVADTAVRSYARVLCHFAALVHIFTDACKEGDGERVIRCWKLCMLTSMQKTYALEALRLQSNLLLSSLTLCTS